MKSVSLNRQILQLAIPAIIANITTPLLSLADIAIAGHLGSAAFVGAIAVGGSLFNMLYWLFSFLRFGTSGITAQAIGAGNGEAQRLTLMRSLLIGGVFGVLIVVMHTPLGLLAIDFLDPDADTRNLALQYFNILVFGAPAVLMQYSLMGWFVGMQNTRVPMFNSLLINVVNIAASLILVFVFHLGIAGIALGSLIAQWIGCVAALILARPRKVALRRILDGNELKRFFGVNVNIFLRTLCLIAVTVWFTRAGAMQGALMLAVNTLLLQLFTLFSYFMDGFAFAAEALCGKCVGAHDMTRLRQTINRLMLWGFGVAVVATLVYVGAGEGFLNLLTDDLGVIAAARDYRLWAVAVPLAGFLAFTWDGIVIGMTRTRLMLVSMAVSTALFFILYFLLTPRLGNHALWLAFVSYLFSRGVTLWILGRVPREANRAPAQ